MAKVIWAPVALNELIEIIQYIERFDGIAAEDVGGRLRALGESLADFPRRGRPAAGGTRELTSVSPYILRYEVLNNQVTVLRIRHSRRRPLD